MFEPKYGSHSESLLHQTSVTWEHINCHTPNIFCYGLSQLRIDEFNTVQAPAVVHELSSCINSRPH